MKTFSILLLTLMSGYVHAQIPVNMSIQPMLTYSENFDSIIYWTNNFTAGYGTECFASVQTGSINSIPDPLSVTVSSITWSTGSGAGLQRDTVNERMLMVVSGTTDNTTAVAFDIFTDFSGTAGGRLSFKWATVFSGNSTSNRKGTLKVYGSVDGISFTELPLASVTITNYTADSGIIHEVPLPGNFNQNSNARLRFYYYNAPGGSTGSRPVLAIDDISIVALGSPCLTPAGLPSALHFSGITPTSLQLNFNTAPQAPDEHLAIATATGNLTSFPADSTVYHTGDIVGDGTVVHRGSATSFPVTNLSPQTTYTFYIFPLNIHCNGSLKYNTITPLTGTLTTPPGPPCVSPSGSPTSLTFSGTTTNSISGSYSGATDATEYIVIVTSALTPPPAPVNGISYNIGDSIGSGQVIHQGTHMYFTAFGLNHSTTYYFFVYSLNNYACSNGPAYFSVPLTGQQSTTQLFNCQTPAGEASNLSFLTDDSTIYGFFHPYPADDDGYLVIMNTSDVLTGIPQNHTSYATGSNVGGGTVISKGKNYSFSARNLSLNTCYYFFIFTYNEVCTGGPLYNITSFLADSACTGTDSMHFYFGNLHAHSSYSDGNKDNGSLTPADNYAYAQNALCMDFLGISEHNHYTAKGSPGMLLPKYQQGINEANHFTATHPGFLALYGMEWGTSNSGGGHVLVYGLDSLIGWEIRDGHPNYDIFVSRNDFLSDSGLFRKINSFAASDAFITLAHPAFSDFQGLAYLPFQPTADSAVSGIAIESGPAFSLNHSYTEPGSSMAFLPYYQHMLAKGYHVAPMIDHDNHNTTFGRTAFSRTVVIASSLSKADFIKAMKNRQFYATQDGDIQAEILIYNYKMGSDIRKSFPPAITVYVRNSGNIGGMPTIRLLKGVPGSNTPAHIIESTKDYILHFTDLALQDSSKAYYYADIDFNGKRTITSPVWYERCDTGMITSIHPAQSIHPARHKLLLRNNPCREQLHLILSVAFPVSAILTIRSLTGQNILRQHIPFIEGIHPFSFSIPSLQPGLYILEALVGNERMVKKFAVY